MRKINTKQTLYITIIILILFTASFLRLYHINYTEFKIDQALNIYLTLDIIENGPIPEHVLLSSINTYNPPLFHYLLILPVLISKNPVFISSFIAILNILAIALGFFFIKSIFNQKIAFLSTIFWAINPWAIMYSRNIWHQNVLSLFIILFFFGILKLINCQNAPKANPDRTWRVPTGWLLLSSAALACLLQIHLSTISLVPIFLLILFLTRKKIAFKDLLFIFLIFLIIFLPYILYEIQHDFYNLNQFIETSHLASKHNWESLWLPLKLSTTLGFEKYLGTNLPGILKHTTQTSLIDYLTIILFISGLIYSLTKITHQKYLILILWLLFPTLFLFFNKTGVYDHYLIILFPVQFIFISLFLDKLFNFNKLLPKILAVLILSLVIIYPSLYSLEFLDLTKTRTCLNGIYSIPYQYQENKIKQLIDSGENNLLNIYTQTCQCAYCFAAQIQYIYDYLNKKI